MTVTERKAMELFSAECQASDGSIGLFGESKKNVSLVVKNGLQQLLFFSHFQRVAAAFVNGMKSVRSDGDSGWLCLVATFEFRFLTNVGF